MEDVHLSTLMDEMARLRPAECLVPDNAADDPAVRALK